MAFHNWNISMKLIFAVLFLCFTVCETSAQSKLRKKKEKIDSILSSRYQHISYDTNYIARPETRLTLKARVNVSGDNIHTKGTIEGIKTTARLQTKCKTTLSISASYLGLSVALAVNPVSLFRKEKDYEFNLNYYSKRFSIDASYHDSKTLSGDIKSNESYHLDEGILDMKVVNISAFYTFNHRRFSYPAAFTQSYIQLRSAGSWLAGISFQGGKIQNSKDAPPSLPQYSFKTARIGLGGGYAYNFVIRKKWLIHLSAMPSFVVYNYSKQTLDGEEKKSSDPVRFNMLFNEHVAVVYNFSKRYFAGFTTVVNSSLFNDKSVVANQNKWRMRAFFGMRLWNNSKK